MHIAQCVKIILYIHTKRGKRPNYLTPKAKKHFKCSKKERKKTAEFSSFCNNLPAFAQGVGNLTLTLLRLCVKIIHTNIYAHTY